MVRWCSGFLAQAGPEGRRTVAKLSEDKLNKLYDTVTHLQRVCGQPSLNTRRGRSTVGACTVPSRDGAGDSGSHPNDQDLSLGRLSLPARCTPFGTNCRSGTPLPVQLIRCQRLSRLCVLMNPYPAGRVIHLDLAGEMLEK